MSYIPPHTRKNSESKPTTLEQLASEQPDTCTIEEIQHHYWKVKDDDGREGEEKAHSTLNNSNDHQGSLTHVLLFDGANPRWDADAIIFVKSNLGVLPQYHEKKLGPATQADDNELSKPDNTQPGVRAPVRDVRLEEAAEPRPQIDVIPDEKNRRPIAVFTQAHKAHRLGGFNFHGYYKVARYSLLAPRSKDLARMLEQKWQLSNPGDGMAQYAKRRPQDWDRSLSYEWAVIKFEKMEPMAQTDGDTNDALPTPPKIEKLPPREKKVFRRREQGGWERKPPRQFDAGSRQNRYSRGSEEKPQKSVNELLAEMRFGKESSNSPA